MLVRKKLLPSSINPNLNFAIDSGAHSFRNKIIVSKDEKGRRGNHPFLHKASLDFSFVDTKDFKNYLDEYIKYLCEYEKRFSWYVCLDIIYSGELSWKIQQEMEANGLSPIPVYHAGEDFSWFKKYADKYEHIGIGGLGQGQSKQQWLLMGDKLFKYISSKGRPPSVKVHGFAITAPDLLKRYPFYSVDSTSWRTQGSFGSVKIPSLVRGKNGEVLVDNWLQKETILRITDTGLASLSSSGTRHLNTISGSGHTLVMDYISQNFSTDFFEVIQTDLGYQERIIMNAVYMLNFQRALKEYYLDRWDYEMGANIYLAAFLPSIGNIYKLITEVAKYDKSNSTMNFLGTFFYKDFMDNLFFTNDYLF